MSKDLATNPALKDVEFLVGEWSIELSNSSFLPDPNQKVSFTVVYDWKADGAVIAVQQKNAQANPPQLATWLIGRDESSDTYTVLYADNRGVSRVYQMSYKNYIWKIWRNRPDFSQRFEGQVSQDEKTIKAKWEKSTDGGQTWEHDFDLLYKKV